LSKAYHCLETDEEQDAILSLELVTEHLPRVVTNAHHWKWVVIALHSALQGFMVLALQGTNALNVLTKKTAKEWMEAYESRDSSYPEPKLDWFPNLYSKVKSKCMKMYVDSRPLTPTESQDQSIDALLKRRNDFIHFVPSSWSLDVSEWPQMVIDVVTVIEFLAFESGNVFWHEETLKERVRALSLLSAQQATALKAYYGGQ